MTILKRSRSDEIEEHARKGLETAKALGYKFPDKHKLARFCNLHHGFFHRKEKVHWQAQVHALIDPEAAPIEGTYLDRLEPQPEVPRRPEGCTILCHGAAPVFVTYDSSVIDPKVVRAAAKKRLSRAKTDDKKEFGETAEEHRYRITRNRQRAQARQSA